MKKLLIFILLIAAACAGDDSFSSRPNEQFQSQSGGNSPLVTPCPYINSWLMNAHSETFFGPYGADREVFYHLRPAAFRGGPGHGTTALTATMSIKNTGNVTIQYRHLSTDPWTTLAIGATHTFTKSIPAQACGVDPSTLNYSIRARVSVCPIIVFGSIFKFKWLVSLVSVDNFHTVATCAETLAVGEVCRNNTFEAVSESADCHTGL